MPAVRVKPQTLSQSAAHFGHDLALARHAALRSTFPVDDTGFCNAAKCGTTIAFGSLFISTFEPELQGPQDPGKFPYDWSAASGDTVENQCINKIEHGMVVVEQRQRTFDVAPGYSPVFTLRGFFVGLYFSTKTTDVNGEHYINLEGQILPPTEGRIKLRGGRGFHDTSC